MTARQLILGLADELVIDLFAGGGGASTGIELAIARHVDIAVNHDPAAVALHQANHPQTQHFVSDVFEVDPLVVTDGRPVGLLWASPDCKHFSKAKGGKPVTKKIRGLAWVVIKWAKVLGDRKPRVICLENVEEFQDWGPLTADGMPCPIRKGLTFRRWKAQLQNLGYTVEHRELRACDYGAPTIRKRLFLVARCDGAPIVWPAPTHAQKPAKGSGLKPWRTAAECIDWSIPAPSIFERERPLAEATMRRIAHGVKRYVLDNPRPFIVPVTHSQGGNVQPVDDPLRTITTATRGEFALAVPSIQKFRQGSVGSAIDEPLHTVTAGGEQARPGTGNAMGLLSATLVQTGYGERPARWRCGACGFRYDAGDLPTCGCSKCGSEADPIAEPGQAPRVPGLDKPLGTAVDGQKHALVAAFMAKHYGGNEGPGWSLEKPCSTITTQDHHHLVASNLIKLRGTSKSAATGAPLGTVSAGGQHHAEVRAFLLKYYGTDQDPNLGEPLHTVTTKDRFGLVTVMGEDYVIADIGMRMLQPRELYRAQGFPESYVIDRGADGRVLTKAEQVRMCGNSVCPPVAAALVRANYADASTVREAA